MPHCCEYHISKATSTAFIFRLDIFEKKLRRTITLSIRWQTYRTRTSRSSCWGRRRHNIQYGNDDACKWQDGDSYATYGSEIDFLAADPTVGMLVQRNAVGVLYCSQWFCIAQVFQWQFRLCVFCCSQQLQKLKVRRSYAPWGSQQQSPGLQATQSSATALPHDVAETTKEVRSIPMSIDPLNRMRRPKLELLPKNFSTQDYYTGD